MTYKGEARVTEGQDAREENDFCLEHTELVCKDVECHLLLFFPPRMEA